MKKEIEVNGKKLTVELKKGKYMWQVLVGGFFVDGNSQ